MQTFKEPGKKQRIFKNQDEPRAIEDWEGSLAEQSQWHAVSRQEGYVITLSKTEIQAKYTDN